MSMTGVLRGGEKVMLIKLYLQEAVQRAFLVAVVYIVLKGIYLVKRKTLIRKLLMKLLISLRSILKNILIY